MGGVPRSIPACAGEPGARGAGRQQQPPVYPRVCGGTAASAASLAARRSSGLSPRVRGNRRNAQPPYRRLPVAVYPRVCGGTAILVTYPRLTLTRSIPACAGEPGAVTTVVFYVIAQGLSPRVRGNLYDNRARCSDDFDRGLSPRVRGNRGRAPRRRSRPDAVYPRVCGGTWIDALRGPDTWLARSIPACAGEPAHIVGAIRDRLWAVYPRVCGGTDVACHRQRYGGRAGSIPACAGEPPTIG